MAWPIPQYSKNQVRRAGQTLVDLNQFDVNTPEDLNKVWHAFEVASNWRSCHGYPINTFQATLRQKLRPIDRTAIVAQRLKRMPSIIQKLRRFENMKLSTMQDIGGLRAVVSTLGKVRLLEKNYLRSRFKHELIASTDYVASPKDSGYRSIHLVYRYNNPACPEYNGLRIELQMRTRLQHAFATAVETVDTFLKTALKSSEGPKVWLDFFSLTGSAFAYLEKTAPVPGYEHLTKEETFSSVIEQAKSLEVRDHLLGFTVAAERVSTDSKPGNYHLIILNHELKRVSMTTYRKEDLKAANDDYREVEQKIQEGEPFQAVLVSAGPIKNLRRAYPNYFLDTREFLAQLDRIESEVDEMRRVKRAAMPDWISFQDNIGAKQSYLDKAMAHGYTFRYRQPANNFGEHLGIETRLADAQVAFAQFVKDDIVIGAHCNRIDVKSKHRRRGIATAIYVLAEHLLGRRLVPYGRPEQSESSIEFWAQKNRPFG